MLQKLNVNPTVLKFASHATYPGISKVFFFKAPHPLFHVAGNIQCITFTFVFSKLIFFNETIKISNKLVCA
jgi:hypothetical protein